LTTNASRHDIIEPGQNVTSPSTIVGHGAVGVGTPIVGGGGGGGSSPAVVVVVVPGSSGGGQSFRNSALVDGSGSHPATKANSVHVAVRFTRRFS
jgi:hypothetical protein